MIRCNCGRCGKRFRAPEASSGREFFCVRCASRLLVPDANGVAPVVHQYVPEPLEPVPAAAEPFGFQPFTRLRSVLLVVAGIVWATILGVGYYTEPKLIWVLGPEVLQSSARVADAHSRFFGSVANFVFVIAAATILLVGRKWPSRPTSC